MIGNIASAPELNTTQSGISRTTFRIAVQRRTGKDGQREADFFSCVAWRQSAEFIANYFTKGDKIALEGSIQNRKYTAQDGSERWVTEIIVDHAEFCTSKRERDEQRAEPEPEQRPTEFTEVETDELPF